MLDANLKAQLKAYLERVKLPFEITASLDDSAAAQEMHGLLQDIVSLSDKITLKTDGTDARKPWDDYQQLLTELELYSPALFEKPRLVVANKMDEPAAEANLKSFKRRVKKIPVLPISAAFDQGLDKFRQCIRDAVEEE